MRLETELARFLKNRVLSHLPEAGVFLFGSRVHEHEKGGDIDILVTGERKLTDQEKRDVRIAFYRKFGERKIDIVSFTNDDSSPFKELALMEAVKL